MQITVSLQELFSYSIDPIFVLIILVFLFTVYFYKKRKKKVKVEIPQIKKIDVKDINEIQKRYIKKLDELQNELKEEKISIREAYQNLSEIVRYFVYEVTDIEVQNYTLKEIKKLNMPKLYNLIKEYYIPEFANISSGNAKESIAKAREVIRKWN